MDFYVDYENTKSAGLAGIQNLKEDDSVHIFFSVKADTVKIPTVRNIMASPAEISFAEVPNGIGNALDFYLVTMLLCSYDSQKSYFIVSADKGYDVAINAAAGCGRENIKRICTINESLQAEKHQPAKPTPVPVPVPTPVPVPVPIPEPAPTPEPCNANAPVQSLGQRLKQHLKDKSNITLSSAAWYDTLATALASSNNKQEFYRCIIAEKGQKEGLKLYTAVKANYEAMRQLV